MAAIVTSGVSVSSARELTNRVNGVPHYTLPVADAIHGRVIARYGIAITCMDEGDAATAVYLHLDAAWQEVADLVDALRRARRVFPVGMPLRYGEVVPGFAIQLAPEDARAFGCELSYVQPYDANGLPSGETVDGCIGVTERALWLAYQQAGLMPELSALSPSAHARVNAAKTVSYGDLREGAAHVQAHGPVATPATRTVDGKPVTVMLPAFPKGAQREAAAARVEQAREVVDATSRIAALMTRG